MNREEQEDFIRVKEILTCSIIVFVGIIISLFIMVIKVDAESFASNQAEHIYYVNGSQWVITASCFYDNTCPNPFEYDNPAGRYAMVLFGNPFILTQNHNYSIEYTFKVTAGAYLDSNNTIKLYYHRRSTNSWVNATCDITPQINYAYGESWLGVDSQLYYDTYIGYSCGRLINTLPDVDFVRMQYNGKFYMSQVSNFQTKYIDLDLIDSDTVAIINNDNANTNKIINNQNQNTDKILNEGSYTKPNKDQDMNSLDEIESEIYNGEITTNTLNDLDLTIDEDSSNFWWEQLENALTTNSLVLSTLITVLTLGIVKLILRG